MRLATWNCQTGLETNWEPVEALNADVLTVQECGPGTAEQVSRLDQWTCEYQPGRWGKGLGVFARNPYAIADREESEPSALSTMISGPDTFRFVGFWAMTEKDVGFSYTRQATRVIERLPDDGVATVVAGDFNASKSPQHLKNVQRLADRGLVSAYHAHHGIGHDAVEEHPTSFHHWQESRPFHMDFVFVPRLWNIESVDVGTFPDYARAGGSSDHTPVVVVVAVPAA